MGRQDRRAWVEINCARPPLLLFFLRPDVSAISWGGKNSIHTVAKGAREFQVFPLLAAGASRAEKKRREGHQKIEA